MTADEHGARVDAGELIALRRRAAGLRLDSRRRVASATAGVHESRFRGRGVDYQESRAYQPGDDIRNMDWRVTARTGEPYTKLYQEERERPVILVLDYNPSAFFGTRRRFKSVQIANLAALIGWATVRYGDRIGAFVFGHGEHLELRPTGGRRGALRLIRGLVEWSKAPSDTNFEIAPMGEAIARLRRVARPGSLVMLISDFYSLDDETERHLTALRQHNDVAACRVVDPIELAPPPTGRYAVSDGDRRGLLRLSSKRDRRDYTRYFETMNERTRELMRRRNVPLMLVKTSEDPVEALRRHLQGRPTLRGAA